MSKATKNQMKYLSLIAIVAIITSCSPKTNHKFLSFFFDGVSIVNNIDSIAQDNNTTKKDTMTNILVRNESNGSDLIIHPPYRDGNCSVCHNALASGMLNGSQKEICYTCHEDLSKKYAIVHGPVAAGFCTVCHQPHNSELPKLLKRKDQSLCLDCHEAAIILKNEAHSGIGETGCTDCHLPHGGKDLYFLNYFQEKDH